MDSPTTRPLAHLRFPVSQSLGRRYPEAPHPYRSEFQRDRDRIVHARAFRRLENKTQVFTAPISDHFRNRLTHSLEVSQIARTAAFTLGLDEDLTEALALAHDFGHPPFAHSGEAELDQQLRRFGDRFDHNLHALRIVESFEQRYARFPGLNLTAEVREGMAKHSRDFGPGEFPELDEYLPGLRPPLEAQIIDLADEIAYNTADLDDGYSAGLFTIQEVADAVPGYGAVRDAIEFQFPGAAERIQFFESLRRLIDGLVTGLIEGTTGAAATCGAKTLEDVRREPARLARLTPVASAVSADLKRFLQQAVYSSPQLVAERHKSAGLIAALFDYFLAHPDRLPEVYAEQTQSQPPHRVVCDYIAGMTDGFFLRTAAAVGLLPETISLLRL
jgi:dGTPase